MSGAELLRRPVTPEERRAKRRKIQRDYRQRCGKSVIAPVECTFDMIAWMLDKGWFSEKESRERKHIGEAISKMLHEMVQASLIEKNRYR